MTHKLLKRKLGEEWAVAVPKLSKREALFTLMMECGYYAEMGLENEIRASRSVNGETFEYKVIEI